MDIRLMELCEQHTKKEEIFDKSIIEVGSCDVNGSFRTILEPLSPLSYLGIDIAPGPGVDMILPVEDVVDKFGENSFGVVVSTEAIEHIKDWRTAINNLKRICKIGGILYLTSRSRGFGYHSFPHDHWRYELEDIAQIFANWKVEVLVEDGWKGNHYGFFLKAYKKTEELIDLSKIALYNIHTDRRQGYSNNPAVPGISDPVVIRRILSEDELTPEELNPPVKYW